LPRIGKNPARKAGLQRENPIRLPRAIKQAASANVPTPGAGGCPATITPRASIMPERATRRPTPTHRLQPPLGAQGLPDTGLAADAGRRLFRSGSTQPSDRNRGEYEIRWFGRAEYRHPGGKPGRPIAGGVTPRPPGLSDPTPPSPKPAVGRPHTRRRDMFNPAAMGLIRPPNRAICRPKPLGRSSSHLAARACPRPGFGGQQRVADKEARGPWPPARGSREVHQLGEGK